MKQRMDLRVTGLKQRSSSFIVFMLLSYAFVIVFNSLNRYRESKRCNYYAKSGQYFLAVFKAKSPLREVRTI